MAEVNPEVRVPFGLDVIHAEMWLREENPSEERLERLIDSQPESARPALRRLIDEAKAHIEPDEVILGMLEPDEEADALLADADAARDADLEVVDFGPSEAVPVTLTQPEDLPTVTSAGEAQASADALDAVLDDE